MCAVFKSSKMNNRAYKTGPRETCPGLRGEPRSEVSVLLLWARRFSGEERGLGGNPARCPAPRPPPPGPSSAAAAAGAAAAAIGLKIASSLPLPSLGPGSRRRPAPGPAARRFHRRRRAARRGGRAGGKGGQGGKEDAAGRALPRRRCADGRRGPGRAARPLHAHDPGAQVRGPGLQDGMCLLLRLARECSEPPPAASAPPPAAAPSPPLPPQPLAPSPGRCLSLRLQNPPDPFLHLPRPPSPLPVLPGSRLLSRRSPHISAGSSAAAPFLPAFVCLFSSCEAL